LLGHVLINPDVGFGSEAEITRLQPIWMCASRARLAREEQKLIRDTERAEEEEAQYQKLLDKAKAEAQSIAGPQLDAFTDQIRMLEQDLAKAHAKVLRAQAMAEKTRSGYVYIISNIGSFGDDIVKIHEAA
jgi:hypothetical protein